MLEKQKTCCIRISKKCFWYRKVFKEACDDDVMHMKRREVEVLSDLLLSGKRGE